MMLIVRLIQKTKIKEETYIILETLINDDSSRSD
jgi:hypothetical protein